MWREIIGDLNRMIRYFDDDWLDNIKLWLVENPLEVSVVVMVENWNTLLPASMIRHHLSEDSMSNIIIIR